MGAVRVGVVSTHRPTEQDLGEAWLPGRYRGGAELSDAEYLAACPEGVSWVYIGPGEAHMVDRVLVTSLEGIGEAEADILAEHEPVVFLHHATQPEPWKARLIGRARRLMLHTPAHEARTIRWCEPREVVHVLSALDESELYPAEERDGFALAASRNHPLKGLKNARAWAAINDYPIVVMTRERRSTVIEYMRRAEVFVHLPLEFESECRSVIEAVLCGCRVVTNDRVGVTSIDGWDEPDELRARVKAAPSIYWDAVCR